MPGRSEAPIVDSRLAENFVREIREFAAVKADCSLLSRSIKDTVWPAASQDQIPSIFFSHAPRLLGSEAFACGDMVVLVPELLNADARYVWSVLAHEFTHVEQQRQWKAGLPLNAEGCEAAAIQTQHAEFSAAGSLQGQSAASLFASLSNASLSGFGNLVQCSTAAYPSMALPQGNAGNLNFFADANMQRSFGEAITDLVRIATPSELGVQDLSKSAESRRQYAKAIMDKLARKPYFLKELVGNRKVMFSDFSDGDKFWVRNKILAAYDKERSKDFTTFGSRIVPQGQYSWLEFRTVDCVFAAVLHELSPQTEKRLDPSVKPKGMTAENFNSKIVNDEAAEAALEAWLAGYFQVERKVMADVQLIYILEEILGWKNLPEIGHFKDLKNGGYKGKSFVISYEINPGTPTTDAFWHTVHVEIPTSGQPKVTDRQAPGLGRREAIQDTAVCDVWQIDKQSDGFVKLQQAFNARR